MLWRLQSLQRGGSDPCVQRGKQAGGQATGNRSSFLFVCCEAVFGSKNHNESDESSNASSAEVPPKPAGTDAASGWRPQPHDRWQVREQTREIS